MIDVIKEKCDLGRKERFFFAAKNDVALTRGVDTICGTFGKICQASRAGGKCQ